MEWFATRREAAIVIEEYRKHYNRARPHSSLGYRTPHEYKKLLQTNPAVGVLTLSSDRRTEAGHMRLFRQRATGDWADVIERVVVAMGERFGG